MNLRFASLALLLPLVATPVDAQAVNPGAAPRARQDLPPQRAELEQRFRERTAEIVQRRLQLNADQMARLKVSNQRFDADRLALLSDERQARQALRAQLQSGTSASQQTVSDLLDQLLRLQRRRLDLVENEQRELAKFMTPVQRAKYFGLQNEIRKRMEELRDRQPGQRQLLNRRLRRNLR